jgi:hypothetical protein
MDTYRVIKISDHQECDCCGKKNLKRTVHMANLTSGEEIFYGVDCASKVMRQRYMGKLHKVSKDAVLSMAKRAKSDEVNIVKFA